VKMTRERLLARLAVVALNGEHTSQRSKGKHS
jgi:hypothetical protein